MYSGRLTKPMVVQGICFSLCFFVFQLTEFTVNDRASALFGADAVIAVYAAGLLCTALGYLSFSLLRGLFRREKARKLSVCSAGVLTAAASALTVCPVNIALFAVSAAVMLLSLGYIGGCVYCNCAMAFQGSNLTGRVIGTAMGVAVLLQFAVQNLFSGNAVFAISVAAGIAAVIILTVNPPLCRTPETLTPCPCADKKSVVILIAAVAVTSAVCALLDSIVIPAHAMGQSNASGWIRLVYVASLISAGFVADTENRGYLSLAAVCLTFLSAIASALFANDTAVWLGTVLIYIFSGFYVIFLMVRFLELAPGTEKPELWAAMGRTVRSFTIALTAIPAALLSKALGNIFLVAGSCVLSVVIMLLMLRDISLVFAPDKAAPSPPDGDRAVGLYASRYGLTPRETEVLTLLLTTEDGVQEIADRLYISRRVLQRYIASIYEKTAVKSRIGLFRSYNGYISK